MLTLPLTSLIASIGNKPPTIWMPEQASTVAPEVDFLFDGINLICYVFFIVITVLMVYFAVKYRRSPENHAGAASGPTHNTVLELTWTIIPLILVVIIFWLGFRGFAKMTVAPKNAYEIQVTAWQWGWNFRYPNGATSDDLVIPAATPVRLIMRSNDVIHSLFIPDFRVKKDVVPGRYSQMWFEAVNPTGNDPTKLVPAEGHHLFCTEYCGTGHSNMNRTVYVLPRPAFDEWLEKTSRWMDDIAMEDLWAIAGPRFFARCVQCHTTTGVDGNGPSWGPRAAAGLGSIWDRTSKGETKFVDGKTLADLVGPGKEYGTPEDYLRDSILNPGKHLVGGFGNAMPTFKGQLTDPALDALIGMMKNIDQFDAAGKPKPGTEAAKIVDEYNAKKSEKQ